MWSLVFVLATVHSQSGTLQCNGNGTFKIMQFTDCHFGESAIKDSQSIASFSDLIDYESPDLIAITGDFVSGYAYNHSAGWFRDRFDYGLQPVLSSQIPWSYLLGNHDDQADWNRDCGMVQEHFDGIGTEIWSQSTWHYVHPHSA